MTRQTPATPPPSTSRLRSSLHAERQQALGEYGVGVIAARDRGTVQKWSISRLGPLFAVGVEHGKGCDRPGIRCKHLGQSVKWWRRDALERFVDDRQQIPPPPFRARHPMQQGKMIHLG